jgi:regulator of RNase E activity RraA
MPEMGPMVGRAVTVVIEPSNPEHPQNNLDTWSMYRNYVADVPGPKIIVVQDLDKPQVIGSFWGEVNSNIHRILGCVGTITDGGAVRDVDKMFNVGFKAIAKRMCIGHAYCIPVRWGCEVEVFGCPVKPGQLIYADKHGFLVIPEEDEERLLESVIFMDNNECNTLISVAGNSTGKLKDDFLHDIDEADKEFYRAVRDRFRNKGEW